MLNPCASFAVFLDLLKSAWGTGLARLWMLLPLGHAGWTAAGVPWSGSGECSPPSPPCLHKRGDDREKANLGGQTPTPFFEFSVAAGCQVPSLLRPAPARLAKAQTAWTSAAGSHRRGPRRNETDPVVTTQLAFHPQPLSVSVGKLQARGHVVDMKRFAGARHPPAVCWASSGAGSWTEQGCGRWARTACAFTLLASVESARLLPWP